MMTPGSEYIYDKSLFLIFRFILNIIDTRLTSGQFCWPSYKGTKGEKRPNYTVMANFMPFLVTSSNLGNV